MKKLVTLGVTGGIAAYKSAELTRLLMRAGYQVQIIMTAHAQKFVTPLTFFTLSQRQVVTDLFTMPDWKPGHVALADESELLIVAPATANFIGKMAHGIADDALTTFALTTTKPVLLAPAMNPAMWSHAVVQDNVKLLQSRGVQTVGPVNGSVACGPDGMGRMSEPAAILEAAKKLL